MNAFEKKIIQFEDEQNEAMDEYFNARPQLFRTREKELLFEAGFRMAKRSQPVVELPSESDVDFMARSLADEYDWDSLTLKEKYIKSFTSGALSILDAIEFDLKKHKIQYRIKGE